MDLQVYVKGVFISAYAGGGVGIVVRDGETGVDLYQGGEHVMRCTDHLETEYQAVIAGLNIVKRRYVCADLHLSIYTDCRVVREAIFHPAHFPYYQWLFHDVRAISLSLMRRCHADIRFFLMHSEGNPARRLAKRGARQMAGVLEDADG